MNKSKVKVMFLLPTLGAGGAERILSFLAKKLSPNKFESVLVIIGNKSEAAYSTEGIRTVYLNKERVLLSFISILRTLKKERPHIVMSSILHLDVAMGIISMFFKESVYIGRLAMISKISTKFKTGKSSTLLNFLTRFGLHRLNYLVCQSQDMVEDAMIAYRLPSEKLVLIHNPITDDFTSFEYTRRKSHSTPSYITIGRLTPVKGHTRILEGLSQLTFPFEYNIVGEGPEYESLIRKAKELGIKDQIHFKGFSKNVAELIKDADFFLQGSYAEGFPNALLESCALGVPVIAYNAPGGTREIVENGVNGYLVNSDEEFVEALNKDCIFNPDIVSQSVFKKFSPSKIVADYEDFFLACMNSNK